MAEASTRKTFGVALLLAFVCAGLVSLTAVGLAERIRANKSRELMRGVLEAVGLDDPEAVAFEIVELATGRFVAAGELGPGGFDPRTAASDPTRSDPIAPGDDVAGLGRRERFAMVGLVRRNGQIEQLILPVRGRGYGGTIRGFVVLDGRDLASVRGVGFTEHAETPGLGAEIVSEDFRAGWVGKRVYDEAGLVALQVVQGGGARDAYAVDGISGASITGDALTRMITFWFGEQGYAPLFAQLRAARGERQGGSDG